MSSPSPALSVIQRAVLRRIPLLRLPAGARVLDAPCGEGALAQALAAAGFDVCAADVDPAAEALVEARFRAADLNRPLPWPDASFDAFFSTEGIEHLENRFLFLREARRVVAPGGTLVVVDYLKHASELMRERFGDRWLGFDPEELSGWLTQAGFTVHTIDTKPVKLGLALGLYVARRPNPEETA